jgi:MFS family permease
VKKYAELLRTPGVGRILVAQLVARFPGGMLALGVLIHVEGIFHSYGAAGLVLASMSVGQAVAGPLTSRWMVAWALRPVLILTTIVCAVSLSTIAFVPMPLPGLMAVAVVAGLSLPPVQPAVRTIYPKMVNGRQLTPLFSLDATAQEVIWIVGPVLVTFVSTQASSVLGLMLSVFFLLAGGAWFIASPEVGRVRIPRTTRRLGAVLKRPMVLLTTVFGILLVGLFSATETGVVAMFGDGSPEAGIVLSVWALSSLTGGLAFGHRAPGPWSLAKRLGIVVFGSVLAAVAWDFWSLGAALLIGGVFIAPSLAAMFAMVSVSVRFSDTAEAYGWVNTGQLIGAAVGAALAGFAIDEVGPDGGFWVAVAFGAVLVLCTVVFRRTLPDLRNRDASPIPDTEPVPTQPS